jgi:hypothetical protein
MPVSSKHDRDSAATESVDEGNDAVIERLVADAGARQMPSTTMENSSFVVAQAAWQTAVLQRQKSKRVAFAVAATAILVALGVTFLWQNGAQDASIVASIVELQGDAQQRRDEKVVAAIVNSDLKVGHALQTAPGSKALLRRASGLTVIVGPATEVVWQSPSELQLQRGVLYVDTGEHASRDTLTIVTQVGRITHVGTQFSVDARTPEIRIAVRSGEVLLHANNVESRIVRGDDVRVVGTTLVRERLATAADQPAGPWDWLALNDASFSIENRTLYDVMNDMCAASGIALTFASPVIEAQSKTLVLHGPPLKLAPLVALDAVLLTTQLQANRQQNSVQILDRSY